MGDKNDTTIVNGLSYQDGKLVSVSILNGKIVKIDHLLPGEKSSGFYVAPGLIDLQVNGFLGVDFSDQTLTGEALLKVTKALWEIGITTFVPTVITNDQVSLLKSFTILAAALDDEELKFSIPGFHLEGPYISPVQGYRGAHLEKYIRNPDWEEFSELQKAAHNNIIMITLAPETEGAIPFIKKCSEAGVVVSLGHHNGSSDIIRQAIEAGASMSTHLGNGCANMINRHDNPLWPQLADDRLTATIITDGFHLNSEEIQCFYKMKGLEHTVLVSDMLDLAGLPPGEYKRGERIVLLTPDVIKYPAEDVLAGAVSPLTSNVTKMMKFTGCSLGNAIRMASTNPARSLGLKDVGELKQGMRADLILFTIENDRIIIQKTIIAGKEVYSKD